MDSLDSPPCVWRFCAALLVLTAVFLAPCPALAQALAPTEAEGCLGQADLVGCAPGQALTLDAARPARRFATYSDLVSLVRARVSVGLVLAPFQGAGVRRLRLELEAVTHLRSPRSVTLVALTQIQPTAANGDRLETLSQRRKRQFDPHPRLRALRRR